VIVREIGSHGHVAYPSLGGTVNTGARLESAAPPGGVLIGDETFRQLPAGTVAELQGGLRVKGKDEPVDAYLLMALP
jgi:adenylate cyclase